MIRGFRPIGSIFLLSSGLDPPLLKKTLIAAAFVYYLLEGGAMNLDCLAEDLEA